MRFNQVHSIAILCFLFSGVNNLLSQATSRDCNVAEEICYYGNYSIDQIQGIGDIDDFNNKITCTIEFIEETNSHWFKWETVEYGFFSFIISPIKNIDDIDFILFESDNKCDNLDEIRCMFSGKVIGSDSDECMGATGLRLDALDICEYQGCKNNSDNFLKVVEAEPGITYYLFVNNFNSTAGFDFYLEGNAKLKKVGLCNQEEYEFDLSISPNPVTDILNLEIVDFDMQELSISILDPTGSLSLNKVISAKEETTKISLDVSDLKPGSHFVRVKTDSDVRLKHFIKI